MTDLPISSSDSNTNKGKDSHNNYLDETLNQKVISRRQLFTKGAKAIGAVALMGSLPEILAACGTSSSATTNSGATGSATLPKANLQLNYLENVQFAGSFFAEEKGYYRHYGIDVTLLPGGPNLAPEPIVASGRALVGITHTAEVIQAINNGADLKIIGACFQKSPTCIASRASAPIRNPQEMIGKKIGVSPTNEPIWQSFLKANHIKASQINVVTVGFDPTPLATGEIDGLVAFYTNEPIVLRLKGVPTYAFLLNNFNYPMMDDVYIVRGSDLKNPIMSKQITSLMSGESKGWSQAIAHPDEAAKLAVTKFGANLHLNPVQQKLDAQEQNQFVSDSNTAKHGLFWMTPQTIAGTIKSLSYGNVKATTSMFSNEILSKVYRSGIKL